MGAPLPPGGLATLRPETAPGSDRISRSFAHELELVDTCRHM